MSKIKILLCIIVALIMFNIFKLSYYFTVMNSLDEMLNSDTKDHLLFVVYILTLLLFFITHGFLVKGLWHIIKSNYFNEQSIKAFQISGILLIIFGILTLIFRVYGVIDNSQSYGDLMPYAMLTAFDNGYTIILGFALITIKGILKKGLILRNENDLTI